MGTIQVATSGEPSTRAAVENILRQLSGRNDALVVVFFANRYDAPVLAQALRAGLPEHTRLIGCSTAGEIGPAGYQEESIVAIALPADDFTVATVKVDHLADLDMPAWRYALEAAMTRIAPAHEHDGGTFAFTLIDGLSRREEAVGHAVQALIGQIPLIGGSAGDGLQFVRTRILHEGDIASDASVVALVRTRRPFQLFKSQHVIRSDVRMVVTGARPAERIVTEINGLPAAEEYARLAGVSLTELDPMAFAAYPVLVRVGGAEHVRSIQKVNADGSLSFYCAIEEGIVLTLATGTDPLRTLSESLAECEARIGTLDMVLACDCILRRLEFGQRGTREAVSAFLRERHVAGLASYGELYRGVHVNQTFTAIAFAPPRDDGAPA
ncbi:FIST domain containing protein [Nitrogeniibacter mangrovi]|uniref:FIST domain containing protein n=1 Tax=Nitrogeniibacter mangrovi TaxID=2016596 RepID=A0A6C1B677_9RHOO|nr:FIST N-terminal domain-containing protein [Nitrogeniibacter mangrovi]QID19222.1 FIST domain containing protein [Nitrogeniibacter mangrovi]